MPQKKRLTWAQLRVGLMSLSAIAIAVVLVFLLTGSQGLFTRTVLIHMYVEDSAGLKVGQPVRLNGIDVGHVKSISFTGLGGNRAIMVSLLINQKYLHEIPVDSRGTIVPEGVFGDKYVAVTRGKSPRTVPPGGEIASLDTREFQEVVNQSYQVLASLNGIAGRIDNIINQVEQGNGTIGKLLYDETLYNRMDAVVKQAQDITNLVANGKGTIGKLLSDDRLFYQADATLRKVDSVVADVQSGKGTIGMLLYDPSLYRNANRTINQAQSLIANVNAGQGTIGKLLKDEELYRRSNTTLSKVGETIDRLNSGQGTIGQLLVNRTLYDTTTAMTMEARQLVEAIRKNPKKYLRIKLSIF
jgi:phospholipid/cholesterol/gamma-HCH transport system substrate-binding protein